MLTAGGRPLPPQPPAGGPDKKGEVTRMAYGLNPRLFVENGPTLTAAANESPRSSTVHRAWRVLDRERRFAIVESALKPANDLIDEYPLAL